jgi:methionyl-tRNA formyltransferase
VFLGTPQAAVPPLEALLKAGHAVSLVVTRPDRPVGRSGRPVAPPVKLVAERHGIAVLQPVKVRGADFEERVRREAPDLLAVVAYGRILPVGLLRVARHGAVNVHFSLLPRYRGAAPVQWALVRGETVTGVTTMLVAERLDEGDILLQRQVAIEPGEHAPALEGRLAEHGAELLLETLEALGRGALQPRPQDHARATHAPLLSAADGEVDPAWEAREIEGRVRGFDPWPGAWVRSGARRLRLVEAGAMLSRSAGSAEPGRVLGLEDERLLVACGGQSVLGVSRLQVEGRRPVGAREAINGRLVRPDDRFESLRRPEDSPGPQW